jgi:hypothetical protein
MRSLFLESAVISKWGLFLCPPVIYGCPGIVMKNMYPNDRQGTQTPNNREGHSNCTKLLKVAVTSKRVG